jgi:5-dehydro-4-deoxyglucarate dehydratase
VAAPGSEDDETTSPLALGRRYGPGVRVVTFAAGPLSFPLTPFDSSGRVDLDVLRVHVEQQVSAGAAAVFVACGTGELPALTPTEHRDVVTTAVEVVAGRVPVFAGAGGGAGLARELVAQAAACGADGALLFPPYLVASTSAGLLGYVGYAAAEASLPVIVYQRSTAVFPPSVAGDLLDIPAVVGLKDGHGDIDALQRLVTTVRTSGHPKAATFHFLNGMPTAEISAAAYRAIGVEHYSSAVHSFAPDIAQAFYRALTTGDGGTVQTLLRVFYLPFAHLRDQVPGYAVALVKAGARLAGLPVGGVRPPLVDADPAHVTRLTELLATARAELAAMAVGESPTTRGSP